MTSVFIADDHQLFTDMFVAFLGVAQPDASVRTAETFYEAERVLRSGERFSLMLVDLNMPGMQGVAGLEQLIALAPGQRIAVVSGSVRLPEMRAVLRAGAVGFVPKNVNGDVFVQALRLMLAGGRYIPEALIMADRAEPEAATGGDQLTPREREVFDALLGGRSNREIAGLMGVSEVTVKMHLQSVFRKIGARNRGDAIRIGLSPVNRRQPG